MPATRPITTAEQLLAAGDIGPCELVRGELVMMSPAGFDHGRIVGRIHVRLSTYVDRHELGAVTAAETGYLLARDPDTVRAPDVGFVRAERLPQGPTRGYFPGAPDLAVEVLSPNDRPGDVNARVRDWLGAGCRLLWEVAPEARTVRVHRSGASSKLLDDRAQLDGNEVVPGFTLPIADIFEGL